MNFSFKLSRGWSVLVLVMSMGATYALPDSLSDADRKEFLEKLEEIRSSAEKSSKSRFKQALIAYRGAIKSDAAAHALYLKCVEKVNFTDQKKASHEFRDWKRRHKDRQDSAEFRRALQHQLNWLLLTVEAAANPKEMQSLGSEALKKVDAIMADHEKLKSHRGILQQNVLSSVYAKAYNIDGLEAKDWPLAPLKISQIYEKVVMPPLRKLASISKLRVAWTKRIEHEGLILKNWSAVPNSTRIGLKREMLPPAYEKWKESGYLELLWNKEMDCYKAGDEMQASSNMLAHLAKYIKHKQSLKWTKDFQELMTAGLEEEKKAKSSDNSGK